MADPAQTHYLYRTPYGPVTIGATRRAVTAVVLGEAALPGPCRPTDLTNRCATELMEYLAGKRRAFSVPVAPAGTDFQQRVWRALRAIPYGQTRTAADIAAAIGSPASYRLVGAAVRANPAAVLVPCHRVVGAGGRTPGAGRAARMREACLKLERRALAAE
ncbi:methylated-DNA--[protein]-cysteine S-methyltransferase [Adlercreutzia faecimuris]|uniref:Methylated-DNA--[protein]-cysteine S-methyltransferase n=1 Tax=Adlercreutzia faecimuris TaxID=2897341 RepID=A0ABS9WIJ3_9ACTN|nr:methylated-DNA--[protein]-cysteine S-methyltransferase [Adlercreutzia sp. JBNU-10]